MADTWFTTLAQSLRNYLPWPHFFTCSPALRHKPMAFDDDIVFDSDLTYLHDLQAAILDDCRLAQTQAPHTFPAYVAEPLLEACCVPVESAKFWEEFGDWPVDMAAELLCLWQFDREIEAWIEKRDIDEAAA